MFDMGKMQDMIWGQMLKSVENLDPEIQDALENTEVYILKEDMQVRIACRSLSGNEDESRRVAKGLGTLLVPILARVIGGLKCKVKYQD